MGLKPRQKILILLILLLSLFLRLRNYALYPQRGATSDEYAFAFLGISLIHQGEPISWSAIPKYPQVQHLTIDSLYFPIISPYFDHPPLFGLLVGVWSSLFNQISFFDIKLATIRLIPIFLSFLTGILVFLIAKLLNNFQTGLSSLLIYSTVTIFVINARLVVAESLLTLFYLGSLFTD